MINHSIAKASATFNKKTNLLFLFGAFFTFCAKGQDLSTQLSFANEVQLLKKHYSPIILSRDKQKVIVLAELQGRVMSSTSQGDKYNGYGWFNYEYLSKPHHDRNAAMGGADRLWFGPDASKYSLFFEPGVKTIPENINVPIAVSMTPFDVISKANDSVTLTKALAMKNYQGFNFKFKVDRTIQLLDKTQLPMPLPADINWVGYSTTTSVENISTQAWTKETGLFSIWDLGAFYPSKKTTVIIPLRQSIETKNSEPLKKATRYFSDIKESHTKIIDHMVYYKADANYMNKIGIPVEHTKPIFGSYDEERKLLTVVTFSMTSDTDADYVNGIWRFEGDAYNGEIINVFNDGAPDEQSKPFGPFYELETSSIALALTPKQKYQHRHTTMHFQADETSLNILTRQLFGVPLEQIKSVF
jgi:hypothetical protein